MSAIKSVNKRDVHVAPSAIAQTETINHECAVSRTAQFLVSPPLLWAWITQHLIEDPGRPLRPAEEVSRRSRTVTRLQTDERGIFLIWSLDLAHRNNGPPSYSVLVVRGGKICEIYKVSGFCSEADSADAESVRTVPLPSFTAQFPQTHHPLDIWVLRPCDSLITELFV